MYGAGLLTHHVLQICGLCRTKPETTYDNFAGDFGEQMVEGYSREGRRFYDVVLSTVE
jgi:hypothetical protein